VYDTVTRKKWIPSIARHRIGVIINDVLGEDWDEDRPVPEAVPYDDCEVSKKEGSLGSSADYCGLGMPQMVVWGLQIIVLVVWTLYVSQETLSSLMYQC
jgi:hypothetical protein